ncbi:MAG: ABC transporter permease [Firmicutes bacterium]|nr:ABC transporter permease [Bacillota bacterium]
MTISKIKEDLTENLGNRVKITFNVGRNKIEEFDAIIKETYRFIFVVETENENKSFSYSDVLTKTVQIQFKQQ